MKLNVVAVVAAAWSLAQPAPQPLTFAEVLRRAHQYVVIYEDHELSSIIAEEQYQQELFDAKGRRIQQRTLRSDYFIFQLPPDEDWFALRDVYEMDGEVVSDRLARARRLFSAPGDRALLAIEIAAESARYNLGSVVRTINLPTFPLRFLRPSSRARFKFDAAGQDTVAGVATWMVAYREAKGPTFSVTSDGLDVPAHGRFWIEPETGAVVQSELVMGGSGRVPARATITTTYRRDEARGLWAPAEMHELYDYPESSRTAQLVRGLARYSDLRPFNPRTFAAEHAPGRPPG